MSASRPAAVGGAARARAVAAPRLPQRRARGARPAVAAARPTGTPLPATAGVPAAAGGGGSTGTPLPATAGVGGGSSGDAGGGIPVSLLDAATLDAMRVDADASAMVLGERLRHLAGGFAELNALAAVAPFGVPLPGGDANPLYGSVAGPLWHAPPAARAAGGPPQAAGGGGGGGGFVSALGAFDYAGLADELADIRARAREVEASLYQHEAAAGAGDDDVGRAVDARIAALARRAALSAPRSEREVDAALARVRTAAARAEADARTAAAAAATTAAPSVAAGARAATGRGAPPPPPPRQAQHLAQMRARQRHQEGQELRGGARAAPRPQREVRPAAAGRERGAAAGRASMAFRASTTTDKPASLIGLPTAPVVEATAAARPPATEITRNGLQVLASAVAGPHRRRPAGSGPANSPPPFLSRRELARTPPRSPPSPPSPPPPPPAVAAPASAPPGAHGAAAAPEPRRAYPSGALPTAPAAPAATAAPGMPARSGTDAGAPGPRVDQNERPLPARGGGGDAPVPAALLAVDGLAEGRWGDLVLGDTDRGLDAAEIGAGALRKAPGRRGGGADADASDEAATLRAALAAAHADMRAAAAEARLAALSLRAGAGAGDTHLSEGAPAAPAAPGELVWAVNRGGSASRRAVAVQTTGGPAALPSGGGGGAGAGPVRGRALRDGDILALVADLCRSRLRAGAAGLGTTTPAAAAPPGGGTALPADAAAPGASADGSRDAHEPDPGAPGASSRRDAVLLGAAAAGATAPAADAAAESAVERGEGPRAWSVARGVPAALGMANDAAATRVHAAVEVYVAASSAARADAEPGARADAEPGARADAEPGARVDAAHGADDPCSEEHSAAAAPPAAARADVSTPLAAVVSRDSDAGGGVGGGGGGAGGGGSGGGGGAGGGGSGDSGGANGANAVVSPGTPVASPEGSVTPTRAAAAAAVRGPVGPPVGDGALAVLGGDPEYREVRAACAAGASVRAGAAC